MDKRAKILDIAMNLNRIGNWAADDFSAKQKRINLFLENTNKLLANFETSSLPKKFLKTYKHFLEEYSQLEKEGGTIPKDSLLWAEKMLTWGNILTHRSLLITSDFRQ